MVFDGIVLLLTAWNACARPRTQVTALTSMLCRDGIAFFLVRMAFNQGITVEKLTMLLRF